MLFHPLSLAIVLVDIVSLYFLFFSLSLSMRCLLQETDENDVLISSPATPGKFSFYGRLVLVFQGVTFLLIFLAISLVFPPILTGIMCGTGVLQISGESGVRMLFVKVCALLVLYLWWQIDLANRELPNRDLSQGTSKAMLCCVPFVLLGAWLNVSTLWAMDQGQSGDCCTLAYGASTSSGVVFNAVIWLSVFAAISIIVLFLAFRAVAKRQFSPRAGIFFFCILILWCMLASFNLLYFFSSYYYAVTQHHCFWCLFLPGNYSVGYSFFLIIVIMLFQAIIVLVQGRLVLSYTELSDWAGQKIRRSGFLIIAGMTAYFLLTLVPVVLWKIQHGVWTV